MNLLKNEIASPFSDLYLFNFSEIVRKKLFATYTYNFKVKYNIHTHIR